MSKRILFRFDKKSRSCGGVDCEFDSVVAHQLLGDYPRNVEDVGMKPTKVDNRNRNYTK